MEGVDYSWGRPNLDALWRAGKRFVSRYLAYKPNGKVLSKSELTALHAKGFGVCLNWEQQAGDMMRGYSVGRAQAQEALRQANELGAPSWVPIYFSADKDAVTEAHFAAIGEYLRACAEVIGLTRVGVYGEYDVIQRMLPTRATWGWQTYAWSRGRIAPKAHFLQYRNGVVLGGADVDLDRTLKTNFGAWWPNQTQPTEPMQRGSKMLYMLQVRGNDSVYVSDGFQYRGISFPLFVFYRDSLKLPYLLIENEAELRDRGGEAWVEDDTVIVTLTPEQIQRIEDAAARGAQDGTGIDPVLLRNIMDEELDEAFSRGADHDG